MEDLLFNLIVFGFILVQWIRYRLHWGGTGDPNSWRVSVSYATAFLGGVAGTFTGLAMLGTAFVGTIPFAWFSYLFASVLATRLTSHPAGSKPDSLLRSMFGFVANSIDDAERRREQKRLEKERQEQFRQDRVREIGEHLSPLRKAQFLSYQRFASVFFLLGSFVWFIDDHLSLNWLPGGHIGLAVGAFSGAGFGLFVAFLTNNFSNRGRAISGLVSEREHLERQKEYKNSGGLVAILILVLVGVLGGVVIDGYQPNTAPTNVATASKAPTPPVRLPNPKSTAPQVTAAKPASSAEYAPQIVDSSAQSVAPMQSSSARQPSNKVRLVQSRLIELGYYTNDAHGIFDSLTSASLKRFQKDRRIPVSGKIDRTTL